MSLAVRDPYMFSSEKAKTVEVLLEYGADVTVMEPGWSILRLAASFRRFPHSCTNSVEYFLMRQVAKMEYMNLSIDEADRQIVENTEIYKGYYELCVRELEMMKEIQICGDVSVFNILMDSDESICAYVENEELVEALGERDYDHEFPIYFPWLKKRFCVEVEKRKSQKTGVDESQ